MDNSPLSTIPPELRTYIYEFCLISHPDPVVILETAQCHPPALLQTCRQIRKESESLYYASNTFLLISSSSITQLFAKWLNTIGTQNNKIFGNSNCAKILKDIVVEMKGGGGTSWLHEEIERVRAIVFGGSGMKMKMKVRLSYLRRESREEIDLDLGNFGESLREKIKEVNGMMKEEGDAGEYMFLSYAKSRLERLLELEEPKVVSQAERKRRDDMKSALGIPV